MSARAQRIILGLAVGAGLLLVGIVAWPSSGNSLATSEPARDLRERTTSVERRASDFAHSQVLPADARLPAASSTDSDPAAEAAALVAGVTLRGHVVRRDTFLGCEAEVWSLKARCFTSSEDGSFELNFADAGEPCLATSPGFQPALDPRYGPDGILLQLGPPALQLKGRIRAANGREKQGWRVALLDATLIEPVGFEASTLESASRKAQLRAQSSSDGSFEIDGLAQRPYTVAAWRAARECIELFASTPATPEQGPIEIQIPEPDACRTVELRCVDTKGAPLARLRVGFPGAPAVATSDEAGRLVLSGVFPSQLMLVLCTADGKVLRQVVDTSASVELVIDPR